MRALFRSVIIQLLALLLAAPASINQLFAQERVPFRQEELDQMLAPVALYPDSLLSQVLMASTYPLEVVQAARWSRANPGLKGQDAVHAAERMDWDPSVKSLTAFPQVLTMMDEKIDWTERLGEAFLAQQADVMDTVQGLRRRAEAAGNLHTNEQMRVARRDDFIYIEPPAPQIVYVPYYDPTIVYGPWWWAAYPPVYWAPPRAYYVVPAYRPVFLWGSGIAISANFFFGRTDWHRRHVTVVNHYVTNVTVNRETTVVNRNVAPATARPVAWQHDPAHRRGVPFRNEAARQRFEQSRVASVDTRRDADRSGAPQINRNVDDKRTADIRQRRLDERRDSTRDRRGPVANNVSSEESANRSNTSRREGRPAPAPQSPTRDARPETQVIQPERKVQPEVRKQQPEPRHEHPDTRNARPERAMPQGTSRGPERSEGPRPQARSVDPRPSAAAPAGPSPQSRARHEAAPAPAPAPRPQAGVPHRPPQADNSPQRGNGREQHSNQRERPATRDNGKS